MNKGTFAGLALACLTLAAPAGLAQSMRLQASIPFEFNLGEQTFPAGEYSIQKDASNHWFVVGSLDSWSERAMRIVNNVAGGNPGTEGLSRLVFNRYGNRSYLHQIWSATSTTGLEVVKSRSEKQALLQAKVKPEQVVLQARR